MNKGFFETSNYFIDEKVNFFQFENSYKVYDDKGTQIGSVIEKVPLAQKLLRLVLNKTMLPFQLEIRDVNNTVLSSISRGWTFFVSKIDISDSKGLQVGMIKQKFKFFKPTFEILSTSEQPLAKITGDWKAWDFVIHDSNGNQIGTISKKWNGALKELFTTADKYNVSIDPSFQSDAGKIAIVSSAITIDMVLKESK